MDNPGISLFQGADININNSQNNEEEEDLEDQIRRKEELQNLLQANLDDFKYDDSTINSSTNISLASADNLDQNYKNAITPNEQLRVLYDARCRELHALKEEYDQYRTEQTKQIDSLKRQNVLFEAELRQLKISMNSVESLLVEKNQSNTQLNSALQNRDAKIESLEKTIKDYEIDMSTYKSEITELQLKLQSQNGPFNLNAKYNSEEFQKSLQDKILKLENTFEEQNKKLEICNNDKQALQEEIHRLVVEKEDLEKESCALLRNFNDAQQQCRDLIDVVEMLRKENDHFKDRLNQMGANKEDTLEFSKQKPMDNVTLASHNEKLKKMLLDKSIEVDTLNTKLRYYENNLKELQEYRTLKSDVYRKEFKTCDNPSHIKDLLLMQNDLQNYRRIIDDKNQQILNLNSNNKDLKEKIEEMLLQTRNEIQNISFKYNVPKLEVMSKELERAENMVKESEERRLSLLKKLQSKNEQNETEALLAELGKCSSELKETKTLLRNEQDQNTEIFKQLEQHKNEVIKLKNQLEELKIERRRSKSEKKSPPKREKQSEDPSIKNEYELLKQQLIQVMEHLEKSSSNSSGKKENPEIVLEIKSQMDQFVGSLAEGNVEKGILENKINSWKKLLDQMEIMDPDEILKSQYQEAVMNLHSSNEKVKELEESVQDLTNALTISEGEKCSLSVEMKELAKKLDSAEKLIKHLESEIKHMKVLSKENNENLKEREMIGQGDGIDIDENSSDAVQKKLNNLMERLNLKENELKSKEENLKRIEQEKHEMKKWLEKMNVELCRLKSENCKLGSELTAIEEKFSTKMTESKEKKDKNIVEDKDSAHNINVESREFTARLEDELMKAELKLRDEIQLEYQKRISDIERRYQTSCKETNDLCKQQKEQLDEQDKKFREYLKTVLTECEGSIRKLEDEKLELIGQFKLQREDFDRYKTSIVANKEKYCKVLKKVEKESKKNVEAWKLWSKKVVSNCLDIEATNKKVRDRVLSSLQTYDEEIAALQKIYDAKIERKSLKKGKM